MPARSQEITATYTYERNKWENGEYSTFIIEGLHHLDDGTAAPITLKVRVENDDALLKNHTYRFYGGWENYTNRNTGKSERQFVAKTFIQCTPHGRLGVTAYLAKAPHVGKITAGKIFDKYQGEAVKMLRTQPEAVAQAITRLTVDHAKEAAEYLEREKAIEDCTIDLTELLDGRGFPKVTVKYAVRKWGNVAAQMIRERPYSVMSFRGCGFKKADQLYLDLGHPKDALKRQALCAWYAIANSSSSTGDTWVHGSFVDKTLRQSIGGTTAKPEQALRLAVRGKILSTMFTDGRDGPPAWDGTVMWVADERRANAERELANMIAYYLKAAADQGSAWAESGLHAKDVEGISDHQRKQLAFSFLYGAIGILQGSPGTGKTWTLSYFLKLAIKILGGDQIAITAFTGRATVRVKELLAEHGVPLGAKTIHSLLGVKSSADSGWSFKHNATNPLPYRLIVIDEASMIGTGLLCNLLEACPKNALILLLGDPNQLPPVEHGAPLRDMIAAGVPCGTLTEIHRNAGGIVQACADIRDGKPFKFQDNLIHIDRRSPAEQQDAIVQLIDAASKKYGVDPIWGCQVVCAVNKNSPVSRVELNALLQNHLNTSPVIRGSQFRLNDKVVNGKNGWLPASAKFWDLPAKERDDVMVNDDGKIYVANGDFGRVVQVQDNFYEIVLQAPKRIVIVPRGKQRDGDGGGGDGDDEGSTGCSFELGYAVSCHKYQGAEIPIAIVVLDDSNAGAWTCSREWLLTAISRGKIRSYCVGKRKTADAFVRKTATSRRKTFLASLIKEGLSDF